MKSIFISHSSQDKSFVRTLARDLENAGVIVWLDERELYAGDSLIDKIEEAINEVDYVGVVLSRASVASGWVRQELKMAMSQEIKSNRIKVIPILKEACNIPSFLADKVYADLSTTTKYRDGLVSLLERLGARPHQTGGTNNARSSVKTGIVIRPELLTRTQFGFRLSAPTCLVDDAETIPLKWNEATFIALSPNVEHTIAVQFNYLGMKSGAATIGIELDRGEIQKYSYTGPLMSFSAGTIKRIE